MTKVLQGASEYLKSKSIRYRAELATHSKEGTRCNSYNRISLLFLQKASSGTVV